MNEKPVKLRYSFEEALGRLARVPKSAIDMNGKKGHKMPGPKKTRAHRAKRGSAA